MAWFWQRKPVSGKTIEQAQQQRTERIAYQVYQNRCLLNRSGSAQGDWDTARRIIRNPLWRLLFAAHCRLISLEKTVWEPLDAWAQRQALLSLIGNAGIILAVASYIASEKLRRDAEIRNAWQTITSAHGQSGSGGRKEALEFLNASPGSNWRRRFPWVCAPLPLCTWPAQSLAGINLSVEGKSSPGVYLVGIRLPQASLEGANLERANLTGSESGRGLSVEVQAGKG